MVVILYFCISGEKRPNTLRHYADNTEHKTHMTAAEYQKVFATLDSVSRRILSEAITMWITANEGVANNNVAVARRMCDGLTAPAQIKDITPRVTYEPDLEAGTLKITVRYDEKRDVHSLMMAFINEHVIAGEWNMVKGATVTSHDRRYTTYMYKRRGSGGGKRQEAKPMTQEQVLNSLVATLAQMTPAQLQAVMQQMAQAK